MAEGTGAPKPGDEKPIHVRVAEALGWTHVQAWESKYHGIPPGGVDETLTGKALGASITVPRYDADWSAGGPLLEQYAHDVAESSVRPPEMRWRAERWTRTRKGTSFEYRFGPTPLVAVCNLILALHAAGKLPEAR